MKKTTEDFERFWSIWPKKRSKGDAWKAWNQVDPPPIEELEQAVLKWRQSDDWRKDGGQYIPYPATWLRRWGWMDEIEEKPARIAPVDQGPEGWDGVYVRLYGEQPAVPWNAIGWKRSEILEYLKNG